MAEKYTYLGLNWMIFEDLPSDDESVSSIDDTDDEETSRNPCLGSNNDKLLILEYD